MQKKVVVMGGGTGTFPVVQALKHLPVDISCVIAVSDSGGSTGRIRDEFGFQPVGDLRQALAALAESAHEEWIRKILLYRFEKGQGLQGHNLGNLILTALQDMTGNTTESLEIAERIFRLHGQVIPVTDDNVNLRICYEDGSCELGEHTLDEEKTSAKKISFVDLVPQAHLSAKAAVALQGADLIIIGPGDYYASLIATLVPMGIESVFQLTKAKILYAVNLMTRATQTLGMTAQDHVAGIEKRIGKSVNYILMNSEKIPQPVLNVYAKAGEHPVVDDLVDDPRVIRAKLINQQIFVKKVNDTAHRSLLRHEEEKLISVLKSLL